MTDPLKELVIDAICGAGFPLYELAMPEWISPETKRKVLNLQFTEKLYDYDRTFVMSSEYLMPCGCTLAHRCSRRAPGNRHTAQEQEEFKGFTSLTADEQEEIRKLARDWLDYWFAGRVEWHDCARVTPETPSGNIQIRERTSRIGPFAHLWTEATQQKEKP